MLRAAAEFILLVFGFTAMVAGIFCTLAALIFVLHGAELRMNLIVSAFAVKFWTIAAGMFRLAEKLA